MATPTAPSVPPARPGLVFVSVSSLEGTLFAEYLWGGTPTRVRVMGQQLVAEIAASPTRFDYSRGYSFEGYNYFMRTIGRVVLVCASDEGFAPRRLAFAYLDRIKSALEGVGGSDRHRLEEQMQRQMVYFNNDPAAADRLLRIRADLDETKDTMIDNIAKVLERGKLLEDLERRSELLVQLSIDWNRKAHDVHNDMWWEDFRLRMAPVIIIGVLLLVFIIILVLLIVLRR